MFAKWAVVWGMVAVAAVLAIPAWLLMRAFNHFNEERLTREEEDRNRAADVEIAKVRDALKHGRRLD